MHAEETSLPGVLVLHPRVFEDDRGFFYESFNTRTFREATGVDAVFVQDNHSLSKGPVLRGLHYQLPNAQAKLVRVIRGAVWDVAVDLRRSSPTFRQWFGTELSAANRKQLWIPAGFAHGFLAFSEEAEVLYKATAHYSPADDRTVAWDDPDLAIEWPTTDVILSEKDAAAPLLSSAQLFD
ncbi:MAG: dTDP-4-dehydrorhamnose 3,5-epimerase [Acidimicrobiia bacterium]|nr:dTDP-4-dehydrorhamnose 3,5-epimerase [Acidimicrobiia bacterium]